MVQSLSASVGTGGMNRPEDVITVQQLLNGVPVAQGAPPSPLAVDGMCGPRVNAAIQHFQSHHFGHQAANGRIDPGSSTLEKLNGVAAVNPLAAAPVTIRSLMNCPHGGIVQGTSLRGSHVLTAADQFVIAGCPFSMSPCVRVQWLGGAGEPLNQNSVGTCLNATSIPQGTVVFVRL